MGAVGVGAVGVGAVGVGAVGVGAVESELPRWELGGQGTSLERTGHLPSSCLPCRSCEGMTMRHCRRRPRWAPPGLSAILSILPD